MIPDLNLYHRAIMIKTSCYWYNNRQVVQWNRIEDPEMNSNSYLILDKGAKTIQWKQDNIFSKWSWFNCKSTCLRMQIDSFLALYKAQDQVDQGFPQKNQIH